MAVMPEKWRGGELIEDAAGVAPRVNGNRLALREVELERPDNRVSV